jgi:molecular chaperone GrpE
LSGLSFLAAPNCVLSCRIEYDAAREMSTPENEEVASSETPVDASSTTKSSETPGAVAEGNAEAAGAVDAVEDTDGDDESLDIEVETDDEEQVEVEVEVDPIAELEAKLAEVEKGKQENYDKFVRATADLENVRKRSRKEVKDGRLDERGKVLRDMLPVVDNLERAVEHAEQTKSEATKSIIEGVQMVLRQFHQGLDRNNVKAMEAVGKPFDPAVHEAVSQAPSAEHPPGTVISVLQTGYMMEDRLLRPALAVVSMAMPEAPAEEESAEDADVIEVESSSDESSESEGQE